MWGANWKRTYRTNGMVIYSSGSPYTPVSFNGKLMTPGQGNNMYQFPGTAPT